MYEHKKYLVFIASSVCKMMAYTSFIPWYHVTTPANTADAGTHRKSSDTLQGGSGVRNPHLLRAKIFPLKPNTDMITVVDNFILGILNNEQDDNNLSSLSASPTKFLEKCRKIIISLLISTLNENTPYKNLN